MTSLDFKHPIQLVLGALIACEEMATMGRQMTFATFCHDAAVWAVETRDLLREIACDADFGIDTLNTVAADGVMTAAEVAQVSSVFEEMKREALTGKIE